jgi:hypothetical protein
MRPALCALAFVSFVVSASAQTTWYVDVQGTPPGTGTVSNPFVSIQQAIDSPSVVQGDTLLVLPGVYAERVNLHGKALTLSSQAGPTETWIEPAVPVGNAGYVVTLAGNFNAVSTIQGFTVSGAKCQMSSGIWARNDVARRCIISGHNGVGLTSDYDFWVERCTVVGNQLGKINFYINFIYITDSIFAHNAVDLSPGATNSHIDYTLVESGGWWGGISNISGDPKQWNPDQGDYRLGPLSPCIDAGNPAAPPDPDGSPRDLGALVYDPAHVPPTVTYCIAKLNSGGCTADIGWSGGASASASAATPFLITGQGVVPSTAGLLFYGFGRQEAPFMGGFHCVEPPTPRVGGQGSGPNSGPCSGSFSYDFNARVQSGVDPLLEPGTMVNAQFWYRDLFDPLAFFSSTSDAIEFAIVP